MAFDPREVIEDFLQSHDLDFDRSDANTFMVTLPGENKLQTHCALFVGDHSLSINAFVIRKPDTHIDAFFAMHQAWTSPAFSSGLRITKALMLKV